MSDVGVFRPDTARQILAAFQQLQSSGLLAPGVLQSLIRGRPEFTEEPKKFTNVSDDIIPPYACMQVVGTETIGGQTFLQVDKPADTSGAAGPFIFNWHYAVEQTKQGVAQKHRVLRAYSNGDSVTSGELWGPIVDSWEIQSGGGPFQILGEDQPSTDVHGFPVVRISLESTSSLGSLSGVATAVGTQSGGDFDGLEYADVTVIEATDSSLIGTTQRLYDRKGCIFDIDVTGYCVWAHELWAATMDTEKACDEMVKYWSADDRCCDANTAIYRECGA